MTTTPSTASQAPAVSTFDNDEFWKLVIASYKGGGNEEKALIEYCDAKLAQANAAAEDFRHMAFLAANASRKAEARATAAEAKLEAIRQGAEGLQEYSPAFKVIGGMAKSNDGGWLCKEELLALLQPQHKADESGLPG